MSVSSSARKQAGFSNNRPAYMKSFIEDAHRLVYLGYQRIGPQNHVSTAEEVITELIANAINQLIEDPRATPWMRRYIAIDDRRVSGTGGTGKSRPRVDIEIIYLQRYPRPRFHFEAKRLYRSDSVAEYLGKEGVGCLVNALYGRDSDDAGMIGYVQSDDCDSWADKIRASLERDAVKYGMVAGTTWRSAAIINELRNCYQTDHERPVLRRNVRVTHMLLLCMTVIPATKRTVAAGANNAGQ